MEKMRQEIQKFITDHKKEMVADWKALVNSPSQTGNKTDCEKTCALLKTWFENEGLVCETYDVGSVNGPVLSGIWGAERAGKPILFSGHYDTVNLAGEHPFVIDSKGMAHGLGVLDMKGGIVIALYVVKALKAIGWEERPVKIMFLGDEEKGHLKGSAPEVIAKEAKGALCAFNMETGLVSNKICVSRKGTAQAHFTVYGVGAHSGNDFTKGRNAIEEAAYKIVELRKLTDLEANTTVAVTIIKGGTVPNGIPPQCELDVDVRYGTLSEKQRVMDGFKRIAETNYIEGCRTEYQYNEYMPPFEQTPEGTKLADFVSEIAVKCGKEEMGQIRLGGGSDASHVTIAGVPTICSIGVRGEFNHTDREYAIVETLFERAEILTNAVVEIEEFEKRIS